jgi:hypothetical protein
MIDITGQLDAITMAVDKEHCGTGEVVSVQMQRSISAPTTMFGWPSPTVSLSLSPDNVCLQRLGGGDRRWSTAACQGVTTRILRAVCGAQTPDTERDGESDAIRNGPDKGVSETS